MEQSGSFIPRQAKAVRTPTRKVHRIYIFSYISYVLFFGTLLAVVAVFAMDIFMTRGLEAQKNLLAEQRQNFNQSDILQVREFERRLQETERLLDNHAALSTVLTELDATTLSSIRFTELAVERPAPDEFLVTLAGRTDDFNSLQFQEEVIGGINARGTYTVDEVDYQDNLTSADQTDGVPADNLRLTFTLIKHLAVDDIPYTGNQAAPSDSQTEPSASTTVPASVSETDL